MAYLQSIGLAIGPVILATLGVLGSVLVAVDQIRKTSRMKREIEVSFRQLVAVRDSLLKARILFEFSDLEDMESIDKLDKAFEDAGSQWEAEFLQEVFGRESARRIRKIINRPDIGRLPNESSL